MRLNALGVTRSVDHYRDYGEGRKLRLKEEASPQP
jgi:hypothetical protein